MNITERPKSWYEYYRVVKKLVWILQGDKKVGMNITWWSKSWYVYFQCYPVMKHVITGSFFKLSTSHYSLMMDPAWSETCWSNFNVWFILEFYITQILISTTSRFECIIQLIKLTGPVLSFISFFLSFFLYFFLSARQPPVGHGLLIHEVSRSHTTTHDSR
jgi:hypothetical protein